MRTGKPHIVQLADNLGFLLTVEEESRVLCAELSSTTLEDAVKEADMRGYKVTHWQKGTLGPLLPLPKP